MAERSFGSVACGSVRLAEIGGKRPSPWSGLGSGLGPGFAGAGLFRLFGFSATAARSNASNISRLRASMPVISKRWSLVIGSAGLSLLDRLTPLHGSPSLESVSVITDRRPGNEP